MIEEAENVEEKKNSGVFSFKSSSSSSSEEEDLEGQKQKQGGLKRVPSSLSLRRTNTGKSVILDKKQAIIKKKVTNSNFSLL